MIKNKSIFFIVSLFLSFMLISCVSAEENTTIEITSVDQEDSLSDVKSFDDLQIEVDDLADGDVLSLNHDYKYNGSSNFTGITVNKNNIVIDGNGHTLDANNSGRIFKISGSDITLKNLVFTNGAIEEGAAIYNNGSNLKIINSTFCGNNALNVNGVTEYKSLSIDVNPTPGPATAYGGAIYNKGDNFTILNSVFKNNSATFGGVVYNNKGANFKVSNSVFIDNEGIPWDAVGNTEGGVIYNDGDNFTAINNYFNQNREGSVIFNRGENSKVMDSNFTDIYSMTDGAAIFNAGSNFYVLNSNFINCTSNWGHGGAVYNAGNNASLIDCNIINCTSTKYGDAIYNIGGDLSNITRNVSNINISVNDIVYGENATIKVNVTPGATGDVIISINNKTYNLESIAGLDAGVYNVTARYCGDLYYKPSTTTTSFNVSKATPIVTIEEIYTLVHPKFVNDTVICYLPRITSPITYGDEVVVKIKVEAINPAGIITLVVNNKNYTLNDTIINLGCLDAGFYNIYAVYNGDANYNSASSEESNFTVGKATPTIENIISTGEGVITAKVTAGVTNVIFTINNQSVRAVVNGTKAIATFKDLTEGIYDVIVSSSENNNFKAFKTTATVNVVNPTFSVLQSRIDNLSDGDTLVLNSDYDYSGNTITINKNNIVIDGQGHLLNGKNMGRILNITASNVTIKNLILANGKINGNGSAIYNTGDYLTIITSLFFNNTAKDTLLKANPSDLTTYGGAIYNAGKYLTVLESSFINNSAVIAGGIYNTGSNALINSSEFLNNNGGAITNTATGFVIENNTFNDDYVHNEVVTITVLGVNASYGETIQLSATINTNEYGTLYFIINNTEIKATVANGVYVANYTVDFIGKQNITARYSGNATIVSSYLNVSKADVNLTVSDVEMFYLDGTRFVALLGGNLENQTLTFNINGKSYDRVTDSNGTASIALNLVAGTYKGSVYFNGTSKYNSVLKNVTILVKSTINGSNLVKMYQNHTQFYATFIGSDGKVLANTTVKFNINGVFYNRTTDSKGTANLTINLNPGNYTLSAINLANNEEKGFNVLVKSLIEANNLTKYYQNASKFEAKIYNKDGSLAINKTVEFNVNGVFYKRTSDSNGVVSLAINLNPGEYTITTIYGGLAVGNKINVLPTLEAKDLAMTYKDGSKFQVKTLNGEGKPLASQNVTFNVNGVFYHKTTGDDGVASLNINLMKGEYIITSYWNDFETGNKISIS